MPNQIKAAEKMIVVIVAFLIGFKLLKKLLFNSGNSFWILIKYNNRLDPPSCPDPTESLNMLKSLFFTFATAIVSIMSPDQPLLYRDDLYKRRWLCRLANGATIFAGFLSYSFPGDITGMYFVAIWLWTLLILHDYDDMSAAYHRFCSYMKEEDHSVIDKEILKDVLAGNSRVLSKVRIQFVGPERLGVEHVARLG